MRFNIISSGSKGNATLIVSGKTAMLIDMGISLKRLEEGCNELGITKNDIDYILITHNHADHISGVRFFSPKSIYSLQGAIPGNLHKMFKLNKTKEFGDFKVTPFKTSHDAIGSCGFMIEDKDDKLVYMTDTGLFLEENIPIVANPTYLIIESNHDVKMLMNSNRTMDLKMRILGEKGHLCNEDSAFASISIVGPRTKSIYLAHLSEECNTPEIALETYREVFKHKEIDISEYNVVCANQHHSTLGGDLNED